MSAAAMRMALVVPVNGSPAGSSPACQLAAPQLWGRPLKASHCARASQSRGVRARRRVTVRAEDDREKKDSDGAVRTETKDKDKDWTKNEDYRKFIANPSIESAIKLEKKKAEERLKELDQEDHAGFLKGLIAKAVRSAVVREKERLEKAEGSFKALDINKLKECFNFDTFYATNVRRFGDGGIFVGNLRKPLAEVKPLLQKRLAEAAGREVDLWFMEETVQDEVKQVVVVQPKSEIDLQLQQTTASNLFGYAGALLLGVTTLGSIANMSGFFLTPNATFDDYVARVIPLFGGFSAIFIVSEVATRLTAAYYGVKLSPTFLIPSNWTGCLGAINNFESVLPNKRALFDIPAARVTSAFATSFLLAVIAFYLDGDLAGGENALYIRPQFFVNNPLLSFIQYVIGPYNDELGNVLPQAVEGLGVPLDPLAFAGLLGVVVTALNCLPIGRLEGGRIAQALIGRTRAGGLSLGATIGLGIGGLGGSVLSLTWAFISAFFRGGEELPAEDEITKLGRGRYIWGAAIAIIAVLALFPNSAGTVPSVFYTPPFWRSDSF